MICGVCGELSPPGKRFCGECGAALEVTCADCGAASEPGKRFCGDCGAPLGAVPVPASAGPQPAAGPDAPVAERRLTTVLFADLIGFTTISERRDPEDVRELLSRYFQVASTVVSRYGGTIEKFIGDAVMAVWGVPVAMEDGAERAVRAGLDLVESVTALRDVGIEDLSIRVGVLTGEVAVTLGAVNEGMVAGDAVNTAARIQSVAAPGEVWVDETTRSLTAAAVSYRDGGDHLLKGKAEPVRLHIAETVIASVGGAQRIDGLEAAFTGRDRELRLVKELFLGALDDRRPRLIALSGPAGVGKTRLSWELEKYVDGLAEPIGWHRARALSYGEGVTFWPFAEMVRYRLGIVDGDPPEVALTKLDEALREIVPDTTERQWIRPRLETLLGLAADGGAGYQRGELFSAWTAFLERVAARGVGVVCVFDDVQHAEAGLLDFIDHLLETAAFPLVVVTMARPELADRRPGWGTGRRSTPVHLEPLTDDAMASIVDDLVNGLAPDDRAELVARSEGIPLYALELVRSLIDRDVVVPRDGRYVLADGGEGLAVVGSTAPPSLHALVAARLDALTPEERRLVQDASVIGEVFSRDDLAQVTSVDGVDALLAELRRKEIVAVQVDRFSPERGQYRFVQALVRTVALETLSRRDRKVRHLAVAGLLDGSADELAAVVARHLLDAIGCAPADPDVESLRAAAVDHLRRAAGRAESLGSPDEAGRLYRQALDQGPDPGQRAQLLEGLARAEQTAGRLAEAIAAAVEAAETHRAVGDRPLAARATAIAGSALTLRGDVHAAIELMAPAYDELRTLPAPPPGCEQVLAEELARAHFIRNEPDLSRPYADRALALAEIAQDWDAVVRLLSRQATIWAYKGLRTGSIALYEAAVRVGREHACTTALVIPLANLGSSLSAQDPRRSVEVMSEAVALARQAGARDLEGVATVAQAGPMWLVGSWDEIHDLWRAPARATAFERLFLASFAQQVAIDRGQLHLVDTERSDVAAIDDFGARIAGMMCNLQATLVTGSGDPIAEAAAVATSELSMVGGVDDDLAILWPLCLDVIVGLGGHEVAEALISDIMSHGVGGWPPLLRAQVDRIWGDLAALAGDHAAAVDHLTRAVARFDTLGCPFYLARAQLSLAGAELALGATPAEVSSRLDAARGGFAALAASPWIERVDALPRESASR